jgi:pimeloyl-ACP methyl ester carboxylesterase
MAYLHILPELSMNYTVNRPLNDGKATARIAETRALAPRIKDFDSWSAVWLEAAQKAEKEERWADAAAFYHNAEFYLPAGPVRNGLYAAFAKNYALAMKGVQGYEHHQIPYANGYLPGFRLPAKGKELATFVFHGGYDSFVEEFYPFLEPLTNYGWTVLGFDGPGQGGAVPQGIYFDYAWEHFAKAVLDYFKVDAVDWLGASCGGYLALRAAAFEPRIKHVISLPASYWGLDMTLRQCTPGQDKHLLSLFRAGDRAGVEALAAEQMTQVPCFRWCITQGMHITGTKNAFDCLTSLDKHNLEGVLGHVKQDVMLTEGEDDHLFNTSWVYRIMSELVCAHSVTTRIFTAREGAQMHCQVGNSGLARMEIVRWLAKFHPGMTIPADAE